MRKVKFNRWNPSLSDFECDFPNEGIFHQWASQCTESSDGFGNYTVALVEMPDGTVAQVLPHLLKFVKNEQVEALDKWEKLERELYIEKIEKDLIKLRSIPISPYGPENEITKRRIQEVEQELKIAISKTESDIKSGETSFFHNGENYYIGEEIIVSDHYAGHHLNRELEGTFDVKGQFFCIKLKGSEERLMLSCFENVRKANKK